MRRRSALIKSDLLVWRRRSRGLPRRLPAGVVEEDPRGPERCAAHHHGAHRHLHLLEVQSSAFLTATNIVNLSVQATFIILLGWPRLRPFIERDRPVRRLRRRGWCRRRAGPDGCATELALVGPLIVGMAACAVIGALAGLLITRLRIPSFVVTLAGLLAGRGPGVRVRRRQARHRRRRSPSPTMSSTTS